MKIIKGLWYLCTKSHRCFLKDYVSYSPKNGYLYGSDGKPHRVYSFHQNYFTEERKIDSYTLCLTQEELLLFMIDNGMNLTDFSKMRAEEIDKECKLWLEKKQNQGKEL